MQISHVTIEEVANQFKVWRQNKNNKFNPIPIHLKDLVVQLLPLYRQKEIISHLNISAPTISSIKKAHGLHKLQKPPAKTNKAHGSKSGAVEQKMTFVPFQLMPPSQSSDRASTSASHAPQQSSSTCRITKTDGSLLVVETSDPKSVIQAFLCSN